MPSSTAVSSVPAPSSSSASDRQRAAALAVAAAVCSLDVRCPGVAPGASAVIDARAPAVRAALTALGSTRLGTSLASAEAVAVAAEGSETGGGAQRRGGGGRALTAAGREARSEGTGLSAECGTGLIAYAAGSGTTPAAALPPPVAVAAPANAAASAPATRRGGSVANALARSGLQRGEFGLDGPGPAPLVAPSRGAAKRARATAAAATAGPQWFHMPAAEMTPELRNQLLVLRSRGYLDPKRHYKTAKEETESKVLPKFVQLGTVVEGPSEYYASRLTRAERMGGSLVDQLLADEATRKYAKRNYEAVGAAARAGGVAQFKRRKTTAGRPGGREGSKRKGKR